MRVVFLGSGAFGLPSLQWLCRCHDVRAVVSQPDRRAGRGGKVTPTPIAGWAAVEMDRVQLLKPERINDAASLEQLRSIDADAWVVIAYGQKLSPELLADRFAINLHASLLPRWRGAAPINAAIVAGDAETGNSVITLADRMDAGLVLGRSRRPIEPGQTAGELHDLLAADGPGVIEKVLEQHAAGTLVPAEQDESRVTLAPKLSKADGWVDLAGDAEVARCRINGLSPWPGVTVEHRGQPLKLLGAEASDAEPQQAKGGTVVEPSLGLIACNTGIIRLTRVQPAGKKPMAWRDYANGRQVQAGEVLVGRQGLVT